jgi:hypothetical protein
LPYSLLPSTFSSRSAALVPLRWRGEKPVLARRVRASTTTTTEKLKINVWSLLFHVSYWVGRYIADGEENKQHTFIILHVDHHHSRGAAPTHDIIHNWSLLRFAEQNKVSTIPTSVRRRRRQPEAEPNLMQ